MALGMALGAGFGADRHAALTKHWVLASRSRPALRRGTMSIAGDDAPAAN
jgi:hypothetical protein